jgi:HSP20 family protein
MATPRRTCGELLVSAARAYHSPYWQPAVDVYETNRGWVLKYELAGVAPEDIEVHVAGRTIAVRGVRRDVRIEEKRQSYCMEISYNRFERALELPCELNTMELATQYRDGMLIVVLHCQENKS